LQRFLTENQIYASEERAAISLVSRWVAVQDLRDVVSGIKKAIIQTYDKE